MKTYHSDFLVIGSGLAGLAFALKVADRGKVVVLSKTELPQANTAMAQGGIAAVMAEDDSFESHVRDTHTAGAGLCRDNVVRNFVQQAPDRIQDLLAWGVAFDKDLTREGGHSFRRILHHEDQTGMFIHKTLLARANQHPNIQFLEHHFAIDLILNKKIWPYHMGPSLCLGSYALETKTNKVVGFVSPNTVLATGGAGKAYLYTSNWSGATGDGIAIAYRAGARVANMEFMQFHPTCLFHPEARNFLLTEALRGEGGELVNNQGEAFMKKQHPLGSLAPRDIVARGIDAEIKRTGAECVYLDMRPRSREFLQTRFPLIFQKCLEYGWDMSQVPIPVVPAAHYLCGGVLTDENGQTDIGNLWALGETACTGFHGANRLASNSLLECLTTAHNAASTILSQNHSNFTATTPIANHLIEAPEWILPQDQNPDELVVISHMWEEIRRLMWNYVGIVRSTKRLERALHRLENILSEVRDYYSHLTLSSDILELRNIAIVADLTVRCALKRQESRGIHFTLDFPPSDTVTPTAGNDTILFRGL
jgi:L-aspartate oxidase